MLWVWSAARNQADGGATAEFRVRQNIPCLGKGVFTQKHPSVSKQENGKEQTSSLAFSEAKI